MTSPEYNPNIPASKSSVIGTDQKNFLNNFASLYNAFSVNHVPLDASSGAGNHTIVQLLEPIPPTTQFQANTGEIAAYARAAQGQTDQIFLRYQDNQPEFQYTNYQIYALEASSTQTPFFTVLPGRIIVYFGTVNIGQIFSPLKLSPEVATNIITMNFCPVGPASGITGFYPPTVTIQEPGSNGIITTINMIQAGLNTNPTQVFYIVLANI